MSGWLVGVPLLVVAASLWRQHRDQVLLMASYAIPSVLFWIFYWPIQGLGVDTGHVSARSRRSTPARGCAHGSGGTR